MKYKIALGTTSQQKISYVQEVLADFKIDAVILPQAVSSGIADQPLTSQLTQQGSINRAVAALAASPEADFGLGIEVGYEKQADGNYAILAWATIIDSTGRQHSAMSESFVMPKYYQDHLAVGHYLSDYVDGYYQTGNDEAIKIVGDMIKYRKPFIISALEQVFKYFLNKKE